MGSRGGLSIRPPAVTAPPGLSLEEMIERARLTTGERFDRIGWPFVFSLSRDFVGKRPWEEATRVFEAPVREDAP